jgi:hypothetical protein
MKDLFVELAQLNGLLGAATTTAVALRNAMLAASDDEAALERTLTDELLEISAAARTFSTDIRTRHVGVNFTDEELTTSAPAREW